MKDEFEVEVYTGKHLISASESDSDSEPDISNNVYNFVLGKRITQWDTSVEPGAGEDIDCLICDHETLINKRHFTFAEPDKLIRDINLGRVSEWDKRSIEKYINNDYDDIVEESEIKRITLNNLIFNFKNYTFDITVKRNSAKIKFDTKAIGGYRHAAIYTGAVFEVHHAVPSSLKHKNTTYVNKITVEWNKFKNDNKYVICSEYKAIDVL